MADDRLAPARLAAPMVLGYGSGMEEVDLQKLLEKHSAELKKNFAHEPNSASVTVESLDVSGGAVGIRVRPEASGRVEVGQMKVSCGHTNGIDLG